MTHPGPVVWCPTTVAHVMVETIFGTFRSTLKVMSFGSKGISPRAIISLFLAEVLSLPDRRLRFEILDVSLMSLIMFLAMSNDCVGTDGHSSTFYCSSHQSTRQI